MALWGVLKSLMKNEQLVYSDFPTAQHFKMPSNITAKGNSSKHKQDDRDATFDTLGIGTSTTDQNAVISTLRKAYDTIGPVKLQSSTQRNRLKGVLREHLGELPEAVSQEDSDALVETLYELIKSSHGSWNIPTATPIAVPAEERHRTYTSTTQPQKSTEAFEYNRATVFPDIDIQIIRAERPQMPLIIQLSDLLKDRNDGSPDGNWINGASIGVTEFIDQLWQANYIKSHDETLWWNPSPLQNLDLSGITDTLGDGETRLTTLNFTSSLRRLIDTYYPNIRRPASAVQRGKCPLNRPSITIIIRSEEAECKSTVHHQTNPFMYMDVLTKSNSRCSSKINLSLGLSFSPIPTPLLASYYPIRRRPYP